MLTLNYNIDMSDDSVWNIVTPDQYSRENLLYLQEVGLFDSGPNYYTIREGLESYYASLTLSGQGILEYDGKKYKSPAGCIHLIDCTKFQKYYTDPAVGSWKAIWVHMNGATAESYYLAYLNATHGQPVADISANSTVPDHFYSVLKLGNRYTSDIRCGIESSSLLTGLLASLVNAAGSEIQTDLPERIIEIRDYLRHNYMEQITLDDLSQKFSISKFHLQRQVKKYLGQTPAEYLINLRLTHSKELLRTTELPVSEVALTSGFNNVSYYINLFRRAESLTPQQYRTTWSASSG